MAEPSPSITSTNLRLLAIYMSPAQFTLHPASTVCTMYSRNLHAETTTRAHPGSERRTRIGERGNGTGGRSADYAPPANEPGPWLAPVAAHVSPGTDPGILRAEAVFPDDTHECRGTSRGHGCASQTIVQVSRILRSGSKRHAPTSF